MIGYVILIVIAVTMSIIIFGWLQLYTPGEEQDCGPDVSIVIQDVSCVGGTIDYTIRNQGLFTIQGVVIRAGDANRIVRETLNDDSIIEVLGDFDGDRELTPGENATHSYTYPGTTPLDLEFEVQAVRLEEESRFLCTNAIAQQVITCS